MADLIIKVSDYKDIPGHDWQNGDIIAAISDRRRRARLARMAWLPNPVSGPSVFERTVQGEYKGNGLHEEIMKVFHNVSVRVLNSTEVEITYKGRAPFTLGPTPITHPVRGGSAYINLSEFLQGRRTSGKKLFRDPDTNEIRWYSRENPLPTKVELDSLWIKLRDGHNWQSGGHHCPNLWPFGNAERCDHLVLYVDDFDESFEHKWREDRAAQITLDEENAEIKTFLNRTNYKVNWETLTGMAARHRTLIRDPLYCFDRRLDHLPYSIDEVVEKI